MPRSCAFEPVYSGQAMSSPHEICLNSRQRRPRRRKCHGRVGQVGHDHERRQRLGNWVIGCVMAG